MIPQARLDRDVECASAFHIMPRVSVCRMGPTCGGGFSLSEAASEARIEVEEGH